MRLKNSSPVARSMSLIATLILTLTVCASAQGTLQILYSFKGAEDGAGPSGGLVFDKMGNLYGTTYSGGGIGGGTVFELVRAGNRWKESVLHSFGYNGDGYSPVYTTLLFDKSGNLYGTTLNGGTGTAGIGVVYELTPATAGGWTEKILTDFSGSNCGAGSQEGVIFDRKGNLFGTTSTNGVSVFELTLSAGGGWSLSYPDCDFSGAGLTNLVLDKTGHLYGTLAEGGAAGYGIVFELTRTSKGWTQRALYDFGVGDTGHPNSLILDASGNLYGTTAEAGTPTCSVGTCGAVFKMTRNSGGNWSESTLYHFAGGSDGAVPTGEMVFDSVGNLYGTTQYGGGSNCSGQGCGTVFKLTLNSTGGWTKSLLYEFKGGRDGSEPLGGVILDEKGNLYGTTSLSGLTSCSYGCGIVFRVTP